MVKVLIGDIFESKTQTLVNTVNCVGVMGKGVALEFKKRFPDMYEDYVRRCKAGDVTLGQPYLYRRLIPPWILNFPTKDHWRSVSRLKDIVRGLEYVEQHYREWGITSLAVPPLGCGQGQLEWRAVGPTLHRHLKRLSIPVELYAPYGTPHEELQLTFLEQIQGEDQVNVQGTPPNRIEPAWVALVDILAQIEKEPYHWPVGRTIFQKMAYFATELNIPTGLQYRRGSFGPYAPGLKGLITRLVNHALIHEERLGRMLAVKVGPTFEDARRAYKRDLARWRDRIDALADLFIRMHTRQAELAATVHFAAKLLRGKGQEKPSETEVLAEVMKWKQKRRPPRNEAEVAMAIRNLSMLGWLDIKPSLDLPVVEEVLLGI
ncbi:MAG TPA: Appr-1-p processing protein [Desulfobacterales bacterium]|nr:Appr-1-p processing protein [Desulfobacterales bacterium]